MGVLSQTGVAAWIIYVTIFWPNLYRKINGTLRETSSLGIYFRLSNIHFELSKQTLVRALWLFVTTNSKSWPQPLHWSMNWSGRLKCPITASSTSRQRRPGTVSSNSHPFQRKPLVEVTAPFFFWLKRSPCLGYVRPGEYLVTVAVMYINVLVPDVPPPTCSLNPCNIFWSTWPTNPSLPGPAQGRQCYKLFRFKLVDEYCWESEAILSRSDVEYLIQVWDFMTS